MSTTPESDAAPAPSSSEGQCASCKTALGDSYYTANNLPVCADCASALQQGQVPKGSRVGRLTKAVILGCLAAAGGALIQYLVLHFMNINAALVTILIGFMVGTAVRSGSGGRGGWRYQIIAVVLTYLAIGAAYVPIAVAELRAQHERKEAGLPDPATSDSRKLEVTKLSPGRTATLKPKPVTAAEPAEPSEPVSPVVILVAVVIGLFALPITVGIGSPLSLLIFGFGLYQAWKITKARPIEVTGPHWRSAEAPPQPI